MKKLRKRTVWVVVHCENFETTGEPCVYEMVLFVCSSRRLAECRIHKTGVAAYSWWKVQQFTLNDWNGEGPVSYYTHTGRPAKRPPYTRAKASLEKWKSLRGW